MDSFVYMYVHTEYGVWSMEYGVWSMEYRIIKGELENLNLINLISLFFLSFFFLFYVYVFSCWLRKRLATYR